MTKNLTVTDAYAAYLELQKIADRHYKNGSMGLFEYFQNKAREAFSEAERLRDRTQFTVPYVFKTE